MRIGASVLLAALCWALSLSAQTPTGRISGRVFDPSRALVPGAEVTAVNLESGRRRRAASDSAGRFSFAVLPSGAYELQASAPGLVGAPRRVRLEVGRSLEVDLKLVVEGERIEIEVSDSTPPIDLDTSALGTVIGRETLASLPLNERQFLDLALLAGGAHPPAPGSELARQNRSGLHLNGAREAANNFLLDGADNNDLYINRLVVSPPLDAVREFRLHAANYQAEFGRSGGAQVNVVTRSGTNDLHGSLYYFGRNEALDARNFFDPAGQSIPEFRRHQFGSSLGGPLRRGKTFFFAGYEGTRLRDAVTKTARVPTQAERGGDFSGLGRPIFDPFTGQPFPDNRVPAERIDPAGAAIASYWPAPNRSDPAQNLVTTPLGDGLVNQFYGRIDHAVSPSNSFYARYNFSYDRALEPFTDGNTNVPGFGAFTINRGHNLVLADTHVFSPATILEARFGFNRLARDVLQQNQGHDIAAELGIPGLSTDPLFTGFPGVVTAGFADLSDNTALPIVRADNTYHAAAALTHIRAAHTLKAGAEFRAVTIDGVQGLFGRGRFSFLGALTTYSLSDLLLGLPTFTIQTVVDNPFRLRSRSWGAFFQDDWRLRPNLTLNLGLRYEYNRPAYDADDRFFFFDLEQRALVEAGTNELGRAGYRGDRNNFAPRIGLSWRPLPGDFVVRAGYGAFHNIAIVEANSGLYFNPPYFDLRLFFPSEQGLLTLSDPFPDGAGFRPPTSVNSIQPDFRTGYAQHFNAGLETALPGGFVVRAFYVGSKGSKLLRRRDLNQPAPGEGEINSRRPIAGFANVVLFESAASSSYHSGVFSIERRFARGLGLSAAYTISKSIDDVSAFLNSDGDQGFPQNSRDFRAERALSNFDQRHRFVFSLSYELPGHGPLLRDWRIFALGSLGSGRPFTPRLSVDNSNTGNTGSIFGADRPDAVGDPSQGPSTPERFFNTDAFTAPPEFTFGNAGRNVLTGPGFSTLDVALERTLRLGERASLALRAEAFNLANRANFDLPNRIADQPEFGRITSAGAARQIQLSVRIRY